MSKVNYVIASWSGSRYNPANDYLKVHLKRLFELKHNLAQITIVRPLGSDNDEYYELPDYIKEKVIIINRPANDRSYGQFIYAYQQYTDQFTHYIIAEDDYVPNIDNFDDILVKLIEEKGCDYLCGKIGRQSKNDRDRCIHNQGIVRASAFRKMLDRCNPLFPVMGPEDGTEQQIFYDYFINNDLFVEDYSNEYTVPYWAKTLTYFTKNQDWETIFVPYQCVVRGLPHHFLSNIQVSNTEAQDTFLVVKPGINLYPFDDKEEVLGKFDLYRNEFGLCIDITQVKDNDMDLFVTIAERVSWMNRGENLHLSVDNYQLSDKLKCFNWEHIENTPVMFKKYQNW